MPAPGPKDGHMSKSSRDLSKGLGVKSNGFKSGGGAVEGWGTGNAKGRRTGKCNGARDVQAREELRNRLLRRNEARELGLPEPGTKRKREQHGDDEKERQRARRPPVPTPTGDGDAGEENNAAVGESEKKAEEVDDALKYVCAACGGIKCGSKNNWENHVNSKKHKAASQRAKGKAILCAMKASGAEDGAGKGVPM